MFNEVINVMTPIKKLSDTWRKVPWRKLKKNLNRLQQRIFKAIREGDMVRAKRLQRLLLSSYSARMLAIRQVTQLNTGKKTAGVDGKKSLSFKERFQLEETLKKEYKNWKHQGLREVPIPKKDGKMRILKIPTIVDRAWQCLVKLGLEPAHEATFHPRSYGFRPGRSTHDCQKMLFLNLQSNHNGINKRILELDIEKCFDRISHQSILKRVICPDYIKIGLHSCLSAGVNPDFPEQGTPQGGVVSPLLANIALNGIEKLGQSIRYADDMVFILKPGEDVTKLLVKIEKFLAQRGMNVSQKKTRVSTTTEGFDFLGWRFYVQKNNGKFRSEPSVENFKKFREKVKSIVNNSNYNAETKAKKLAAIVRGWRNYHKYCKMDGSRFSLWDLNHRTFKVFLKQKTMNRYEAEKLVNQAFPNIGYAENRFVNVQGDRSPFDGDMKYWSERNCKLYDGYTAKALKRQQYACGYCGLNFADEEPIELHHIDGNHSNNHWKNHLAVHRSCHNNTHAGKSRKD
jgi:RNA-directed DNA polymerase